MAKTVTGVDVGLRSNVFLKGHWKGNTFHVSDFACLAHKSTDAASSWAVGDPGFKVTGARVGLTGRDVNVRYTRVPRVPDWQLRKLMSFEVEEIGDQSGSEVASDFNLLPSLPEIEDEDVVLLAMAHETLLEQHLEGLATFGGTLDSCTPASLGLYNAWVRYGVIEDETVLIANIGHENLDVILVRGADLLFARNLSGGSRLFDEAVAERFGVSAAKGESVKIDMATLQPGANYADANQEKASRALMGPAGQLLSLLQSTVMFCRSQVKVANLRVDRVLVCGGGAALKGLPEYLSSGLSVPVEVFDPFRVVDVSALDPEAADRLEEFKLESVVALGLATMGSDPEAYSIEILPAKLRARREFVGGTLLALVAAALAVCFLVYQGFRTSSELGEVSEVVGGLEGQLKRAETTHRKASDLVDRNTELAEVASLLLGVAGSGEQVARTLHHMERTLPEGFWIDSFNSGWNFDDGLGILRGGERPILHVGGRAREGTESISTVLDRFVSGLRERFPDSRFEYAPSPSGDKFDLDFTLFAPPREDVAAGEDDAPGEDSEEQGG